MSGLLYQLPISESYILLMENVWKVLVVEKFIMHSDVHVIIDKINEILNEKICNLFSLKSFKVIDKYQWCLGLFFFYINKW